MLRSISRHVNSALSRGVGYEPLPPGLFFDNDAVRGYYIDFRSKILSPDADSPSELLPGDLAQLALGWWERGLAGESGAFETFEHLCTLLEKSAEAADDGLRWAYDVAVPKFKILPPTYSAMAQGQIASVFVRAYLHGSNPRHAEIALAAIESLVTEKGSELVTLTPLGPVLEESEGTPGSHILNGWIFSLWGLWDVALGLGDERARATYDASLNCLRQMVDEYDVGWWTKYCLYPFRLPDLAKPFYHRLHIDQMDVLYRLTGFDEFRDAAERWRRYNTTPRRMAALAQKVAFVAMRYA